jgi:hypothetical protein
VVDLLLSEDLPISVRNQSADLFKHLLAAVPERTDGGNRLHTLYQWALTTKNDHMAWPNLRQLNHKAGTMLAAPWPGLWDAMKSAPRVRGDSFHIALSFVRTELELNPRFAGHFQNIFEMFLRCSAIPWTGFRRRRNGSF